MDPIEVKRRKLVLLLSSLACLVLLATAAWREHFGGNWRKWQERYRRRLAEAATTDAARAAAANTPATLHQLFLPALDRVDRCPTCHLGIDNPAMSGEPPPLGMHPGLHLARHPSEKFGCTICHDGQGRAVDQFSAHGEAPHWPSPLLRCEQAWTSCSRCHYENDLYGAQEDLFAHSSASRPILREEVESSLPGVEDPSAFAIARGKKLVLGSGCLGCHRYRGRGGSLGPDITHVGEKTAHDFDFTHVRGDHSVGQWLFEHFLHPANITPGTLMPELGFTRLEASDLTQYMLSLHRKSAPAAYTPTPPRHTGEPVSGARLWAMFCSGCHGASGQGSTVREAGDVRGADVPPDLMVPSLNNPDTLAIASDGYLRSIILHGRPGTTMPAWGDPRSGGLLPSEIDRLVAHIRSWQRPGANLAEASAERGDARVGSILYRRNCSACHGDRGEGGIGNTLSSTTFLAVASDELLARTIVDGRPGTAMPAWRELDTRAVSDLLAHLRSWQPRRSDPARVVEIVRATEPSTASSDAAASPRIGRILYRANCLTCHGPRGEGDLGPSLATQEFLTLADDRYLAATIIEGRPGTGMPAWRHLSNEDVASLILWVRTWQEEPSRALPDVRVEGDWDAGRLLWTGACSGCHGTDAEGGVGPQLNNPVFLRAATDSMLREWIRHGKSSTPMRGFLKGEQGMVELSARQIDDVVAWLRSLERRPRVAVAKRPDGRPELGEIWYAMSCVSCHGPEGEGASGPALTNPAFLHAASDGFLMATLALGRDGTEMRPVKKSPQSILSLSSDQLSDIVAWLRQRELEPPSPPVARRWVVPWDFERGHRLFTSHCSGCHGREGKAETAEAGRLSAWAPALNNPEFLRAASDGFLQATIVRGRRGTAMRPFGHGAQGLVDLTSRDIDDIVAWIRHWSEEPGQPLTIPATIVTAKTTES